MKKEKKKFVSMGLLAVMIMSMGAVMASAATPENTTSTSVAEENKTNTKDISVKPVENHWYKGNDGKWHEKESYVGEYEK